MNNIKFNIEEIDRNTDLIHKLESSDCLDKFVHFMILNNEINEFIPYVYEPGRTPQLRYSVSRSVSLSDFLKNNLSDASVYFDIVTGILNIILKAAEYMIDSKYLLLDNDYIYINPNNLSLKMLCIPDINAAATEIGQFMTELVKNVKLENAGEKAFKADIYEYDFDNSDIEDILKFFTELKDQTKNTIPPAPKEPQKRPTPAKPLFTAVKQSDPPPQKSSDSAKADVSVPQQTEKPAKSSLFSFGGLKKKKSEPKAADISQKSAAKREKPMPVMGFEGLAIPGMSVNEEKIPARQEIEAAADIAPQPVKMETVKLVNDEPDDYDDGSTVFLGAAPVSKTAKLVSQDGVPYIISKDNFTIGRGGKTAIQIDMVINSKTVSRFHASIYRENGVYFLVDNSSPNGTFLNGIRVLPNEKTQIADGSKIRFSDVTYTFTTL